nr:MAG TPA: hypothetical protein [Caudoviricetes sp.]
MPNIQNNYERYWAIIFNMSKFVPSRINLHINNIYPNIAVMRITRK